MAEVAAPRRFTRRTFLGWWIASLMTATVITGALPLLIFLWPAPPKGQKKTVLKVTLDTPINQIQNGDAIKFDAPTSPNSAFIMADGGGDNGAGELAFGGFVSKDEQGKVQVFAQNCSHLGCSVALAKPGPGHEYTSFDCPCHGSQFHLDGTVRHGPAAYPLSHLTWKEGDAPNTIQVDGIILGF
jgi:Rieske Fe-S protein